MESSEKSRNRINMFRTRVHFKKVLAKGKRVTKGV
jgi:hypothetical protein